MNPTLLNALAADLQQAERPLFLTGAGISVASGIAPFRGSADAVWSKTVMTMGTRWMFLKDPVQQWSFYLARFDACREAQPNPAHHAITQLQAWKAGEAGALRLVTQNIDGLHVLARTHDVIEVHGAARRLRCSREGCDHGAPFGSLAREDALFDAFRAAPGIDTLPRCPACAALLRAHVLWFDESYNEHAEYRFREAATLCQEADLVVFIGTSFSVGITELASTAAAESGAKVWTLDPHSAPFDGGGRWLQAPSEVALPALVGALA